MRLGQGRHQQDEASLDMTPMLDIVFIMLIFFIVTSSVVQPSQIDVRPPQAQHGQRTAEPSLTLSISADNQVYFQQQLVAMNEVAALLSQQPSPLLQGVLLINADQQAYNGTVVKVMDAAKAAGIAQISLATEAI